MWLQRFVLGMRRTGSKKYPLHTLHMLLSSLQRYNYVLAEGEYISFFLRTCLLFGNTCGSYYRELHEQGVRAATKEMKVFSLEDLDKLLDYGVLSADSPRS